ncbi:MAG: polysaccharide biosynthesis/export family protein [Bacteroidia bacterium]|nr:polysaccharide biosynthesis/export family protein [Bacteroidia bacterium]
MKLTCNSILKLTLLIAILNSCASREDFAYFQDEKIVNFTQPKLFYDLIYQPNDMLTIDVNALDPETVKPFNLGSVPYNLSSIEARANIRMQTYIVDKEGNIEFPVLGKVKIGGLTRQEATDLLESKISDYVKDPLVNIRITNFTITLLGEVNNPGTFIIQDEKVTLAEALGLAGDLTIYGKRKNILLVREIEGIKKFSIIDLTSVKSLSASTFGLKQNDVIYVEPNTAQIRASNYNRNNSILISAIGTLTSVAALIISLTNTN